MQAEESNYARRWKLKNADLLPEFRRLIRNDKDAFRGVQEEALKAIARRESPLVVVMSTGGGKSILFMLPAFVTSGGMTVVVVPLVALRTDLTSCCEKLGISCMAWKGSSPAHEAAIVLVTPEAGMSEDFIDFLNRQTSLHRLDRVVIDECHLMLGESMHFRSNLGRLGSLTLARAPMLLLTATLPPSRFDDLCSFLRVSSDRVGMYRDPTRRSNIRYEVRPCHIQVEYLRSRFRWVEDRGVVQLLEAILNRFREGKIIIYGQTRPVVRSVANAFGCDGYFSDQSNNNAILDRFFSGEHRVIAATGALVFGVDIADVRAVVHLGRSRSLFEFAQESGPAGRDGKPSLSVILLPDGDEDYDWSSQRLDASSRHSRDLVYQSIETPKDTCRRRVLDRYRDGEIDLLTCQDDEEKCDLCLPAPPAPPAPTVPPTGSPSSSDVAGVLPGESQSIESSEASSSHVPAAAVQHHQ